MIKKTTKGFEFLNIINNGFSEKIARASMLQEMYEKQTSSAPYLEPTELVEKVSHIINDLRISKEMFDQNGKAIFKKKESIPLKQLFALYAINKIATK